VGSEPERWPAVPGAARASDRERDMVVEVLGQHAAIGRLTLGDLEERISAAFAAKTRAELDELTSDLPEIRQEPTTPRRPVRWWNGLRAAYQAAVQEVNQRRWLRLSAVTLLPANLVAWLIPALHGWPGATIGGIWLLVSWAVCVDLAISWRRHWKAARDRAQ
jgi:hypothetical protein